MFLDMVLILCIQNETLERIEPELVVTTERAGDDVALTQALSLFFETHYADKEMRVYWEQVGMAKKITICPKGSHPIKKRGV